MVERPALLEAQHVWKWLGADRTLAPALHDVSLRIPTGSWSAIIGPSGSGKTTLLSLLGALDRPSQGQILFEGEDLTEMSDLALARVRRRMAFVFQEFALIPRLPLWENVTYPLVPRGVGSADRRRRAVEALGRVGLQGYEGKRPEELSGGERQRASLARAVVGEPTVILADEPTSNLDAEAAAMVTGVLREMHAGGTTVLVATHDAQLVSLAEQVYALRKGALIQRDP